MKNKTNIYPVIMKISKWRYDSLTRKQRVGFLSDRARMALRISADKLGFGLDTAFLKKDENSAPLPVNGFFWSLTHKPDFVGAVMSPWKIGIDIEKIKPCSEKLYEKIADYKEWSVCAQEKNRVFFRFWTAKEAVLKKNGVGISHLGKCKIVRIDDDFHLTAEFNKNMVMVEHFYFNGHIASVTKDKHEIEWIIANESEIDASP